MRQSEIRVRAQLHTGAPIDQTHALMFSNECLIALSNLYESVCRKKKDVLENVVANEEVLLPDDCFQLIRVRRNGETYTDYELYGQGVFMEDNGNYQIEYLKEPDPIDVETSTPDVPSAFHPSIALFVAAREKFRLFGEEDVDSIRLMREFAETAQMADLRTRKHGRKRVIKPNEWR